MRIPLANVPRSALPQGALVALVVALVFAVFHFFGVTDVGYDARIATRSAFVWLWRRWEGEWNQSAFAIGHWVPLLFLLMLWSRRHDLRAAAGPAAPAGLAVVLIALAAHWVGARAQQTRLSLAAFALLAWAIPFYCAGGKLARRLAFPCAFLLFAMPLNFLEGAVRPLRTAAVQVSALLLAGFGLDIHALGSRVAQRGPRPFALDLADSAGSLYALLAVLAIALVGGYLLRLSLRRRLLLVAVTPVAFVTANVLRALAFALPAAAFGDASVERVFARWSGPVYFLAAILLLVLLPALLRTDKLKTWWRHALRPTPPGSVP